MKVTLAPAGPLASTVIGVFSAMVTTGGVASTTLTTNEPRVSLWAASTAVQVTVVSPMGNQVFSGGSVDGSADGTQVMAASVPLASSSTSVASLVNPAAG